MKPRCPAPQAWTLNGICPYFTMFPLSFPFSLLRNHATPGALVLDPFCGRGTTLFAARILGLPSYGMDSNPVAVAITRSKLAKTTPACIIDEAERILSNEPEADIPRGEFWDWSYSPNVLRDLCRLRSALIREASSETRQALIGILLGALHGPIRKSEPSYFSNQCTRTFAPKPGYATKFWKSKRQTPPDVDVLDLIIRRAARYFGPPVPAASGTVILADSRNPESFDIIADESVDWVITSPPYYGMRTYLPDQWLRLWFLGGADHVDYRQDGQLTHSGQEDFAKQLSLVWQNAAKFCRRGARMVIRFGAINDRKADPITLLRNSLAKTPWRITTIRTAGTASRGRRQALHFSRETNAPLGEYDVWAALRSPPRRRNPMVSRSVLRNASNGRRGAPIPAVIEDLSGEDHPRTPKPVPRS